MPTIRRFLLLASLLLPFAAGFGCAGTTTETRAYARELGPLVGRAPIPYFIDRFGAPEKRTAIDSRTEVLQFVVAEASLPGRNERGNVAVATELRLTFKDGILADWKVFTALK
jgi:hypothetical protein